MSVLTQPTQQDTLLPSTERQARWEQVALLAFIVTPFVAAAFVLVLSYPAPRRLSTCDRQANRVQVFMAPLASSVPLVREGRLRALGVSSPQRVSVLAEVPTIAEAGLPRFRVDSWGAMFAPAKTPRAIIDKLNREVRRAIALPEIETRMRDLGAEPAPTTPAELDKFIVDELATIAKLAQLAGIKPQ